jgi:glycosyltransferase involved in cell wall biosynthesis
VPEQITVLQVIPRMQAGGAELGCLQITQALVDAGHRALVVSAGGQLVPAILEAGGEHIEMPVTTKNLLGLLSNARKLAELIRRHDVDIVHARSRAPAWSALLATRQTKTAFVTTYHSQYSERGRLKNLYNSVMARSDMVIAVSDYMAHLIRTRYRAPESRIAIIHRAFDDTIFDPDRMSPERMEAIRRELEIGTDRPVFLLAGRITPRKAQHHLVDALGRLAAKGKPDWYCVFAGDVEKPGYRQELEDQAGRLGILDTLRFPGHVREMAAAYAAADIAFNISEQEGLPRVAIEAQAMGVPMIVSDTGPGREVARTEPDVPPEAASGLRVPFAAPGQLADAIERMLALPAEERRAMGARGAAYVRANFTLDQLKSKTLQVYRTVLERRRGNP